MRRGAGGTGRDVGRQPPDWYVSLCTELPAPSPASVLRADLAGILGVSGVLLSGCIYLLYLLCRQRHW